jgi:hypothetical protein
MLTGGEESLCRAMSNTFMRLCSLMSFAGHPQPPIPSRRTHWLLDCLACAGLRAALHFAPLFADLPAHARMHALVRSADQHTLGAFVHACFERRTLAT